MRLASPNAAARSTRPMMTGPRLSLALVAALLLVGAAPATADSIYRRGVTGPIETLDPQKAATVDENTILLDLFEGLVTIDAQGRPVPGAAESWTISPDGLVYTFKLRDGARWSNGDPVKAADFVTSFQRLFSPATEATEDSLLLVIKNAEAVKDGTAKADTLGVKAIDPATLEITLERPTPTFLVRLTLPAALPVNVASIKTLGADFGTTGKIVSNGPYRLAAIDRKDGYILAKNPRFAAADQVAIDSVVYRPFENAGDCVEAYRAGEVESCPDVPTEALGELKTEFGAALHLSPYAGTYFLVLNTAKKPFDDVRVRQALSMAIDREALAETAWSGGMSPATTLVPPALSGLPPLSLGPIAVRRAEAATLLAEAGISKTKPLRLQIRVGTGLAHEETARLIVEQWKAIGVDATVQTEPNNEHYARLRDGGDYDVARAGWIVDEADPIDMLSLLRGDNVRFNYGRYKSAAFDSLLEKASAELDPTSRTRELTEAQALVERDAPVIPLLNYVSLSLVSPKLTGWQDNVLNLHPTRFISLAD